MRVFVDRVLCIFFKPLVMVAANLTAMGVLQIYGLSRIRPIRGQGYTHSIVTAVLSVRRTICKSGPSTDPVV